MMIVGLHSGEQLIVQDQSYFITVGQAVKQVFITEDGKRRVIVDESRIEFYNELNSTEYMDKIHQSIKQTIEKQNNVKEGVEYV